jgi:kynurenine 3-monooxygenase
MRDSVRSPRFQRQKLLALELERRFPLRFVPRYSMVMFHHEIGYARAFARGKVQQRILDQLTPADAPCSSPELSEIDWALADRLITTQLEPLR